jgi:hypothetical protein
MTQRSQMLFSIAVLVLLCVPVNAQNIYPPPFSFSGEPYNSQPIAPNFFAYVTNQGSDSISGYQVHVLTGGLTGVPGSPFATGPAGADPIDVAVDPTGRCAVVTNSAVARFSPTVSIQTAVRSHPTGRPSW